MFPIPYPVANMPKTPSLPLIQSEYSSQEVGLKKTLKLNFLQAWEGPKNKKKCSEKSKIYESKTYESKQFLGARVKRLLTQVANAHDMTGSIVQPDMGAKEGRSTIICGSIFAHHVCGYHGIHPLKFLIKNKVSSMIIYEKEINTFCIIALREFLVQTKQQMPGFHFRLRSKYPSFSDQGCHCL